MLRKLLIVLVCSVFVVGCAKKPKATGTTQQPGSTSGVSTTPQGGSGTTATAISADPFSDPANPLSHSVIYFDYDSSAVRSGDIDIINAHARYLVDNPSAKIRLEGHADERGSREYNVALSENRGLSVKQLMMFQGIRSDQTEVVAFGEERPLEFCHAESCWSKNRRVEIIYEAK